LLVYLLLARPIINLMPYSVLAAMLIFTGYKLCRPKVWQHVAHIGSEQLFVFTVTVVATLATDLLWGIITGIATKWLLTCWFTSTAPVPDAMALNGNGQANGINGTNKSMAWHWMRTLTNPVAHRESVNDEHHIYFQGPLVSFNILHVNGELARTPSTAKRVFLHLTDHVPLVDHTSCERLLHFRDECDRNGTAAVELIGLDRMAARSTFPTCMRTRHSRLQMQRAGEPDHGAELVNGKDEGGMTWISLSDPNSTADSVTMQPVNNQAQARADMDWLDLEKASDGEPQQPNADAQARADMDWLDLRHAVGGAAGKGGAFSLR
jgi:MFS superfamily sulfate permease-like transporter